MPFFDIRRLGPPDATAFRVLRLEALQQHPDAFGSSWQEEDAQPIDWFQARLAGRVVLGGFVQGVLVGVAGLYVPEGGKERHKAVLWGMYVRPVARGTGLAAALVAEAVARARGMAEEMRLTVVAGNAAALRLYVAAGFVAYGREPRALKVDGRYHDEVLMALPLR